MGLAACGADTSSSAGTAAPPSLEALGKAVQGFSVGTLTAARKVYVFYDMQCPHCGTLWFNSKPLHSKVNFIWVPVGVLGNASVSLGATILDSQDPQSAMDAHEKLLHERKVMAIDNAAVLKHRAAVEANTQVLRDMKVGSVPYIVAQDPVSGALIRQEGSMDTAALAALLKL